MENDDIENSDFEANFEDVNLDEAMEAVAAANHEAQALLEQGVESSEPSDLFIIPLTRRPFFPGMAAPIVIEPGIYYEVLKKVAAGSDKCLGLFLTKDEDADVYSVRAKDLYQTGTMARILRIIPLEQGGAQVVLNMEKRITIEKAPARSKYLKAKVAYHSDPPTRISKEIKAYSISIITTIKELLKLNPLFKEELQIFLGQSDFTEPGRLADFAVALTTATRRELQDVLSSFEIQKRIDRALILLKKELDLNKLQSNINRKIEATISKTQREFFLKEQLKTIKKELGLEKDDHACDVEKFEERLKKRKVPESVQQVIEDELDKLQVLDVQAAEYSICRGYLDWLTIVPWGIMSRDKTELKRAQTVLDRDHFGLEDVKKQVLELISVGKLSGGLKGNIICLVGPPGVGKTSIGKSIAAALGRKFFRFSVGGMRDEAEIKGHRRTYIGAMPGKLIQALKATQTMNPVIMLDEVDKMGSSFQGDPASALLEVLDPEQNVDFLDHYLDVRCDLSNVLFILTANVLDTIPEPLRDRTDILRLSGYIHEEKLAIAKKYLVPKQRKQMGLKPTQVGFQDAAISEIINGYAREAGVRSLENYIKKILRKVARTIVEAKEKRRSSKKVTITKESLKTYINQPIFTSDRFYDKAPVGVCMGLAWTSLGGATLYVETTVVPQPRHKGKSAAAQMKFTGMAGDVMKESSQIAWTYISSHYAEFSKAKSFFEDTVCHIHIPEGATPKDGPSAGVTMVTALISLLRDQPVNPDVAMTGEITLTGRVLPIGGVKEKLIAARRSGVRVLIFPKDNRRDFDELASYLKEGLDVHFVEYYSEIFPLCFDKRRSHRKVKR